MPTLIRAPKVGSPKPANHSAPVVLTFAGRSQAASANSAMAMGHATALAKAPTVLPGCSRLKVSPMSAMTKATQTTEKKGRNPRGKMVSPPMARTKSRTSPKG